MRMGVCVCAFNCLYLLFRLKHMKFYETKRKKTFVQLELKYFYFFRMNSHFFFKQKKGRIKSFSVKKIKF